MNIPLDGSFSANVFTIQLGKNSSWYRTSVEIHNNFATAKFMYDGTNVFGGYKKRLLADGKVIAREISPRNYLEG